MNGIIALPSRYTEYGQNFRENNHETIQSSLSQNQHQNMNPAACTQNSNSGSNLDLLANLMKGKTILSGLNHV